MNFPKFSISQFIKLPILSAKSEPVSHLTDSHADDVTAAFASTVERTLTGLQPVEMVDVDAIKRQAASQAINEYRAVMQSPLGNGPLGNNPWAGPIRAGRNRGSFAMDNPITHSIPQSPRHHPGSPVTVDTLRRLADNYDILRSCIDHLKTEVAAVPLQIVAKDPKNRSGATARRIKQAEEFFAINGGLGGLGKSRADFEGAALEDILVIGASAIHTCKTRGGGIYEINAIDAATIRPVVDAYGWPGPGDEVYEQWIMGVKVAGFRRDQLTYGGLPIHARSYTPYYMSGAEYLVHVVNAALRADGWNMDWLTDGNTPGDMLSLPEAWTPEDVERFQEYWDALMSDPANRQRTKFVPGAQRVASASRKDNDFQEFMLWLLRRTCSIYGVQPASIGYAGEQYKVSQENSMGATSDFRVGVLLQWRKQTYDNILTQLGLYDIEVKNVTDREEDANERAARLEIEIRSGQTTINEARRVRGEEPVSGGDVLLIPQNLVPLSQAGADANAGGKSDDPSGDDPNDDDPNDDPNDDDPDDTPPVERGEVERGEVERGDGPPRGKTTDNPHNTPGSFSPGGSHSAASTWKASMSRQEAEAWSKDSVIKEDLFHGGSSESLQKIGKEGVDPSKSRPDVMFGHGLYLSNNPHDALTYNNQQGTFKINVQHPFVVNLDDAESYERWENLVQDAREAGHAEPDEGARAKVAADGYDCIQIEGPGMQAGDYHVLVWDKEKAVMIK